MFRPADFYLYNAPYAAALRTFHTARAFHDVLYVMLHRDLFESLVRITDAAKRQDMGLHSATPRRYPTNVLRLGTPPTPSRDPTRRWNYFQNSKAPCWRDAQRKWASSAQMG